jgi:phosphoribosylformylglycinamidine synthase PurS subunit
MKARVYVTLKPGVLDPQGKAIQGSLHSLGFSDVETVRLGKFFEISLAASSPQSAEAELARMCEKLLANTVIEKYRVELVP